jgi:hypothetical protein
MVGRICPLGLDRVKDKVSENLGATAVAPVVPVVTSLRKKLQHQLPLCVRFVAQETNGFDYKCVIQLRTL